MSTVKTTNLQHPSASDVGITLGADGSVVLPQGFAGGLGTNVVQTVKTDTQTTTSTSFIDVTGLAVTITPTSASSKVLLVADVAVNANTSGAGVILLFTDSSNNPVIAVSSGTQEDVRIYNTPEASITRQGFFALLSPATASPVTYKVRFRSSTGGSIAGINKDNTNTIFAVSTITAIEVAA